MHRLEQKNTNSKGSLKNIVIIGHEPLQATMTGLWISDQKNIKREYYVPRMPSYLCITDEATAKQYLA